MLDIDKPAAQAPVNFYECQAAPNFSDCFCLFRLQCGGFCRRNQYHGIRPAARTRRTAFSRFSNSCTTPNWPSNTTGSRLRPKPGATPRTWPPASRRSSKSSPPSGRVKLTAVQKTQQLILVLGGTFGAVGLAVLLLMAYLQWRAVSRLVELFSAHPAEFALEPGPRCAFAGRRRPACSNRTRSCSAWWIIWRSAFWS